MNKIDCNKTLAEQFHPIDFSSFQCGDAYVIRNKRTDKYTKACIDHFWHGIAIAHYGNYDCLINIYCEIIYTPAHHGWGKGDVFIKRHIQGYEIYGEVDIAAPGKDFQWVEKSIGKIDETFIQQMAVGTYQSSVIRSSACDQYEQGKLICFNNVFYDYSTREYKFTIPSTLKFYKKGTKCFIEDINGYVFNKDDFKEFTIEDTQYYRNLIVKVDNSKIISFYPFPVIEEEPLRDISYQNYSDEPCIDSFYGLDAKKYVNYLFADNNKELRPTIENNFNLLNTFPELKNCFNNERIRHDDILCKYGKDNIVHINERDGSGKLLIRFIPNGFIIQYNSSYRNYSKHYVFNEKGDLLNTNGYDKVEVVANNLMFRRGKVYGIGCVGIYDCDRGIELKEKNIYTCDNIEETTAMNRKNFHIGLTCGEAEYVNDYWLNHYYKRNLEMEKAAAICIFSWKGDGPGFRKDFTNSTFYAGIPYVLKKENIDEVLPLEPIIENYLYKLPNNRVVDRNSILFPFWYREFEYCMYSIDKIKYATEEAIKKTQHSLLENCRAANPYITNIKEIKKLGNYFLFEYRPFGKIDSKGNITYEFGDPSNIEL